MFNLHFFCSLFLNSPPSAVPSIQKIIFNFFPGYPPITTLTLILICLFLRLSIIYSLVYFFPSFSLLLPFFYAWKSIDVTPKCYWDSLSVFLQPFMSITALSCPSLLKAGLPCHLCLLTVSCLAVRAVWFWCSFLFRTFPLQGCCYSYHQLIIKVISLPPWSFTRRATLSPLCRGIQLCSLLPWLVLCISLHFCHSKSAPSSSLLNWNSAFFHPLNFSSCPIILHLSGISVPMAARARTSGIRLEVSLISDHTLKINLKNISPLCAFCFHSCQVSSNLHC
jgi:hypothetical protein